MENKYITSLQECVLFYSLSIDELVSVFTKIDYNISTYYKEELLVQQDEVCNRLIILLKGSVKAEMSDPGGKIVKVEDIKAPSPLAILFLFGKENRFPVQVTALEETVALVIPKSSVLQLLQSNEKLLKNYLDISANFASRLSRKLHLMSFRTIRQKLAIYLLEQSQRIHSTCISLDKSKSALAEYFGVSRPSLERELSRMQQDGLILSERRRITILVPEELSRIVNF